MLRKTLLFLIFFTSFTIGHTQEPQFKFYLAFEDAKQERDTVWFGLDEAASTTEFDSLFGDTLVVYDTAAFQVFFGATDSTARKTVIDGTSQSSWSHQVFSNNGVYPITIRWDTLSLAENDLPFPIAIAWLNTQSPQINDFKLFRNEKCPDCDSLVLDSFMIGGGWASHFPIKVSFFKGSKTGLDSPSHRPRIVLYPVPSTDYLMADSSMEGAYKIMDSSGHLLMTGYCEGGKIDLTGLSAGYYILSLTTSKHQYHEIFSKR